MDAELGAKQGGRLGSRIVALFMLAASVPVLVLALLAWGSFAAQSTQHAQQQLDAEVGAEAMRVFDRLVAARTALRLLAARDAGADADEGSPTAMFRRLAVIDGTDASTPTALQRWWRGSPRDAARTLHWQPAEGGQATSLVLTQPGAREGALWLAEVDPAYLWSDVFESMDTGTADVLDREGRTLHANSQAAASGSSVLHAARTLFLQKEFGAEDWLFRAQRTHEPTAAHELPVGSMVLKLVLATMLLVGVLSLVQVRRTMDPLGRLVAVTRRLARQDYAARVELAGDDEFSELGRSFNDMAEQMQGHVRELQVLSAIDRDILDAADTERLLLRVLERLAELAPGAAVAVVPMPDDGASLRAHVQHGERRAVELDAADLHRFADVRDPEAAGWLSEGRDVQQLREKLGLPPGAVYRAGAAARGRMQAVLLVAAHDTAHDTPVWRSRIDELSHRVAVALSSAAHERRLSRDATHDSLTGLRNRAGLHLALAESLGAQRPFAVLFADLDRFKGVNDSLGHHAGDELLRLAARRVAAALPAGAVLARPGGDEFVVLLDVGADGPKPNDVAHTLCERLAEPFAIEGREIALGASIGWALYPDDGLDAVTLARRADLAMYAAKERGRGRAARYEAGLGRAAEERAWIVNDLRRAVAREQLVVHYQPRVEAASGRALSAEALVRWQHPQRGLVPPGLFIPVAEETGTIRDVGRWVLDETCRQIAAWRREGVAIDRVSVNLSAVQLGEARLYEEIVATISRHGIAPRDLELEITESAVINDSGTAAELLGRLRRLGIKIALDDFGTGYSSMAYLSRMPVDVIKIDRAFVQGLGRDASADGVTRAIVALAKSLRLALVAEGVETAEQAAQLRAMGCEELQGYLFSRPVPAADYARLACVATEAEADRVQA